MDDRAIVLVRNPNRAHKLLCLLEGRVVVQVETLGDLVRVFRTHNGPIGLVLIDSFGRWGGIGLLGSMILRAPLVVRLRGEFFREVRERGRVRARGLATLRSIAERLSGELCLRAARGIVYNSQYLAGVMGTWSKGRASAVVYNPFTSVGRPPCEPVDLPRGGLRLLSVTNLNLSPKVEPMITAIRTWLSREMLDELDIQWVICGGGALQRRLQQELQEAGLTDRVHVVGRVDGISAYYAWCDVLVHLTRMDSFPNVTLEAMHFERPVVINEDSCGTREQVINDYNGYVVSTPGQFLEALRAYASDTSLRSTHGRAGRAFVEQRFSVGAQTKELEAFLRDFR